MSDFFKNLDDFTTPREVPFTFVFLRFLYDFHDATVVT